VIDIREVINGTPLTIFAVNASLIVEDAVKTNVVKVGNLFNRTQVNPVVLAQAKYGAAGAKHLFPKMGKWVRRSLRVDD
jgi:hypothetical protein